MQFGDAVTAMKNGLKVFRPGWDRSRAVEPGAYLKISPVQAADAPGGSRETIIYHPGVGTAVGTPWLLLAGSGVAKPLDEDLLADDWEIRQ